LSFTRPEFRATLKERQMTELEELKESTKDSVQAKQVSLYGLVSRQEPQGDVEPVYDTILDLIGDTPTMYKLTVAQTRRAEDLDEIAGLWDEARTFYQSMLASWESLDATLARLFPELRDELFAHWGQMIRKLARACAEHHDFHARK